MKDYAIIIGMLLGAIIFFGIIVQHFVENKRLDDSLKKWKEQIKESEKD